MEKSRLLLKKSKSRPKFIWACSTMKQGFCTNLTPAQNKGVVTDRKNKKKAK